jgi:hypothetical protein
MIMIRAFVLGVVLRNSLSSVGEGVLVTMIRCGSTVIIGVFVGAGNRRVIAGKGSKVGLGVSDGVTVTV